jgi:hypothetical protein
VATSRAGFAAEVAQSLKECIIQFRGYVLTKTLYGVTVRRADGMQLALVGLLTVTKEP